MVDWKIITSTASTFSSPFCFHLAADRKKTSRCPPRVVAIRKNIRKPNKQILLISD